MPRRSAAEPFPPSCPHCGTLHVEVTGHEGINGQLAVLRCTLCGSTWNELVSSAPAPVEDDSPEAV